MRHIYTCVDCIEKLHGAINKLPPEQYKQVASDFAWEIEHLSSEHPEIICPRCGSKKAKKVLMVASTYVGGYGYLDKDGAKNDMNLHLMQTGQDPYADSRPVGDADNIVQKLRKNKQFNTHPKKVYL